MLRAASPRAVDGFLRYYHAIGFEQIVLFFDKPDEDAEAIALAREHAAEVGGVMLHLCDARWWADERRVESPAQGVLEEADDRPPGGGATRRLGYG